MSSNRTSIHFNPPRCHSEREFKSCAFSVQSLSGVRWVHNYVDLKVSPGGKKRPKWADKHETFCASSMTICLNTGQSITLVALIQTTLFPWPRHSKSEWKPSSLIKTVDCSQLSGGHAVSLPRWKDATLANNKVSFFFRLCCRHSVMHCPFKRRSLWSSRSNATHSSFSTLKGTLISVR